MTLLNTNHSLLVSARQRNHRHGSLAWPQRVSLSVPSLRLEKHSMPIRTDTCSPLESMMARIGASVGNAERSALPINKPFRLRNVGGANHTGRL